MTAHIVMMTTIGLSRLEAGHACVAMSTAVGIEPIAQGRLVDGHGVTWVTWVLHQDVSPSLHRILAVARAHDRQDVIVDGLLYGPSVLHDAQVALEALRGTP